MMKGALSLVHISEAEFINQTVSQSPGMVQVLLLESLFREIAKSGYIGVGGLEGVERLFAVLVGEVVIGRELLLVINMVIKPQGSLIRPVPGTENRLEKAIARVWGWHEAQQIRRNGILTRGWDFISRKDVRICHACRRGNSSSSLDVIQTCRAAIQDIGYVLIANHSVELGALGKITGSLQSIRDGHSRSRNSMNSPKAFV